MGAARVRSRVVLLLIIRGAALSPSSDGSYLPLYLSTRCPISAPRKMLHHTPHAFPTVQGERNLKELRHKAAEQTSKVAQLRAQLEAFEDEKKTLEVGTVLLMLEYVDLWGEVSGLQLGAWGREQELEAGAFAALHTAQRRYCYCASAPPRSRSGAFAVL